jgi:hypothetical protein
MGEERGGRSVGKRVAFAVAPALLLMLCAELTVRVVANAESELQSLPLPPESVGLFRSDDLLMWSLRPNLDRSYLGARIVTNSLGLRSPEVARKAEGEYRVLSLGESTTFGSAVAGGETYTALLAAVLQAQEEQRGGTRVFTAINGGVPAYSSFQSLKYIEERGLELEPDLLLFYHEVNDYLPSSLRDSSNNEIGVLQTDWELWEARHRGGVARWIEASALVRLLRLQVARRRVASFDREDFANPLLDIGLPDIGLPPRMMRVDGDQPRQADLPEVALAQRVSEAERLRVLERLLELSEERGFELLLIHPAYQASRPHECVLTRFGLDRGVPLFEAGPVLHPRDLRPGALYRDSWHPRAEGHARLARALAREIRARHLGSPR